MWQNNGSPLGSATSTHSSGSERRLKAKAQLMQVLINNYKQSKVLQLDDMIKYSKLRFMHSYTHHNLPFSFEQLWTFSSIEITYQTEYCEMPTTFESLPTILHQSNDFLCLLSPNFGMKNLQENSTPPSNRIVNN